MTPFSKEARAFVLFVCLRSELAKTPFKVYLSWRDCSLWKHGAYLTNGQISFFLVELKLVFSSGTRLYLLKVGFMGTAVERTLVQEHPRNIYLLDIDWKRNLVYWTNAQGQLFCSTGYSGEKQEIWTEHTGKLDGFFGFSPLFSGSNIH